MIMSTMVKIEQDLDAPRIPPGNELVGTSQGSAYDKPPEHWILEELERFGVIGRLNLLNTFLPEPVYAYAWSNSRC